MVVTACPATAATGRMQVRTALPSICMVQAPHNPAPHPNLEPFNLKRSRITHNNGVFGSSSLVTVTPFNSNSIVVFPFIHVVARVAAENRRLTGQTLTSASMREAFLEQFFHSKPAAMSPQSPATARLAGLILIYCRTIDQKDALNHNNACRRCSTLSLTRDEKRRLWRFTIGQDRQHILNQYVWMQERYRIHFSEILLLVN